MAPSRFVCVVCFTLCAAVCLYSLFVSLQNEMILMVGRKEANDEENEYGFYESILSQGLWRCSLFSYLAVC